MRILKQLDNRGFKNFLEELIKKDKDKIIKLMAVKKMTEMTVQTMMMTMSIPGIQEVEMQIITQINLKRTHTKNNNLDTKETTEVMPTEEEETTKMMTSILLEE